jgi:hypothetical protein
LVKGLSHLSLIVETFGGGVKSPEGLDVGALWIGKRLAETNCDESIACSLLAGIAVTARMSPEATAAMWNDALVTKTKQGALALYYHKYLCFVLLVSFFFEVILFQLCFVLLHHKWQLCLFFIRHYQFFGLVFLLVLHQ